MSSYDFQKMLAGPWNSRETQIALLAMLMVRPELSDTFWALSSPVMQGLEPREKELFGHWVDVWTPLREKPGSARP